MACNSTFDCPQGAACYINTTWWVEEALSDTLEPYRIAAFPEGCLCNQFDRIEIGDSGECDTVTMFTTLRFMYGMVQVLVLFAVSCRLGRALFGYTKKMRTRNKIIFRLTLTCFLAASLWTFQTATGYSMGMFPQAHRVRFKDFRLAPIQIVTRNTNVVFVWFLIQIGTQMVRLWNSTANSIESKRTVKNKAFAKFSSRLEIALFIIDVVTALNILVVGLIFQDRENAITLMTPMALTYAILVWVSSREILKALNEALQNHRQFSHRSVGESAGTEARLQSAIKAVEVASRGILRLLLLLGSAMVFGSYFMFTGGFENHTRPGRFPVGQLVIECYVFPTFAIVTIASLYVLKLNDTLAGKKRKRKKGTQSGKSAFVVGSVSGSRASTSGSRVAPSEGSSLST